MTEAPRFLLYSHDTFGLGHLRRNGKIANALAAAFPDARIVIATGSQKAGSFALSRQVELVRLPGIYKVTDGSYHSGEDGRARHVVLDERRHILAQTASSLLPHVFIADKEPLGLLGELEDTLHLMRSMGTHLVLGLRDVLDEPATLKTEWEKKNITAQLDALYDEMWIYGPEGFHDPLAGLDLLPETLARARFLGFIDAPESRAPGAPSPSELPECYILVTAGGGGDGQDVMQAVLAAYEADPDIPLPPVFLLGPFMEPGSSAGIRRRAAAIPGAQVIDFETQPERLLSGAAGVVAMCGYNTFCEVMSHDKPGLFIPREKPRLEQFIRAEHASARGLSAMMRHAEALARPAELAAALRRLPAGPRPSTAATPISMCGLDALCARVGEALDARAELERLSHA
ncbi:MAG: glycosyltransferase family protein [Pararhizobium sp.]